MLLKTERISLCHSVVCAKTHAGTNVFIYMWWKQVNDKTTSPVKTVVPVVRSSQHQTQIIVLHGKRFLNASLTAIILPCKPLCGELWKPVRADNQRRVDWELDQYYMGVYRSGVGSIGTGSSHRRRFPGVEKMTLLSPILQKFQPYRGKETIWELLPCIVSYYFP